MGLVDMQGKVALVTGGARGIGRSIVMALAQAGASVAVADLRMVVFLALESAGFITGQVISVSGGLTMVG